MSAIMSSTMSLTIETAADAAVRVRDLTKIYGSGSSAKQALQGINLDIPRGSFFGLLGPNGAGKSTFINILAGLTNKTSGDLRIWGYDYVSQERRARQCIGVVTQDVVIDPFFTPAETLDNQAGLYGVKTAQRQTENILRAVGLWDERNAYTRFLSGGMKRRLMVAKALVHRPPILVLDEPTAGVDVELRQQLWQYVRELNAAGTTIILTTHYLEEAEKLCDRIAIINHGQMIACASPQELTTRSDTKDLKLTFSNEISDLPSSLAHMVVARHGPKQMTIRYRPSQIHMGQILQNIQNASLSVTDITTLEPDLEDAFLALTRQN